MEPGSHGCVNVFIFIFDRLHERFAAVHAVVSLLFVGLISGNVVHFRIVVEEITKATFFEAA